MKIIRFKTKEEKRARRAARVRAKVIGSAERPRLSVFRSNRHIGVQLIDDAAGRTLVSVLDREIVVATPDPKKKSEAKGQSKVLVSELVGKLLADKAQAKKITQAVFDRAGHRFTGRIKAVAQGARDGGLKF